MERSVYWSNPLINYSYKIKVDYIVNNVKHNCIIKISTSTHFPSRGIPWVVHPYKIKVIKHHELYFEKELSKEQISKLISNKYIYKSHTIQKSTYCNICQQNICSKKYFHKICRPCFNKNKNVQCYKCNNLFIICNCGCPASKCNYCVGGSDSLYCSTCI